MNSALTRFFSRLDLQIYDVDVGHLFGALVRSV